MRTERSLSTIRPSPPTSCPQCEEHVQVINLWKLAVRSVAKSFLSVHKELIKAEAYTNRITELSADFRQDKNRSDVEHEPRGSIKGAARKKGRSESWSVEEDAAELLHGLKSALNAATELCRKGAFDCFETKSRPDSQRSSVNEEGESFKTAHKRFSLNEAMLSPGIARASKLEVIGKQQSEMVEPSIGQRSPHPSDTPIGSQRGSLVSSGSSSDLDVNDHTHILDKLQGLEEERDRLLGEIEKQRLENLKTRQSLAQTWNNLENQNLQLTMALQDLSVATAEIKKASNLQTQLNELEQEKQQLLDKLESLEDESSCVKLSLVQLLQEKSAYSKHLELENTRLLEAFQHERAISPGRDSNSSGGKSPPSDDIIDDTLRKPSLTEEEVLAAIGDISDIPVHKQGFMVKEGGRVKTWKKRLFVLNSIGLHYYKAENPAGCIRIDDMKKVEPCKSRTNTFKISTAHRNYRCTAPNQEEMHSWMGMLESLRQHKILGELTRSTPNKMTESTSSIPSIQLSVRTVDIPRTRPRRSPQVDRKSLTHRKSTQENGNQKPVLDKSLSNADDKLSTDSNPLEETRS